MSRSIPLRAVLTLVGVFALSCTQSTEARDCRTDLTDGSLGIATGAGLDTLDDADLDAYMSTVADSGAGWIRFDMDWSIIEPARGRFDWSGTDRIVAAADSHDLQVLGLLTHTPCWARTSEADPRDPHGMPADPGEFGRFAGDVADRYSDSVTHWEIWNEPNLTAFFTPQPDVGAYADLLVAASDAIRNVAPEAVVITGGLSPGTDNGSDIAPTTFLAELYDQGVSSAFDVVGMHPYSYPALPSDASTSEWNAFYRMREMRTVMVERGDSDKPIWATEFGAPTGTGTDAVGPTEQADILRDGITEQRALGFVDKLFVYSLLDLGTEVSDREQNFGVLAHDGSPKPAWDVLRTAAVTPGCL
ncbi:cellulase family glycosylhydrolase [Rhodococcus sp. B50]|uniref:cellulase family glycosylhydrolase n=1 Tax=Rhodococcus sp. B50 TaxID=2682847 RepID=UPI0027DC99D3|nr:cellulase family glycosylhydrolase [Rhodococcus sp. B50]